MALCDVHKGLNSDLVNNILIRVQHEVTSGFRQIEEYPELVGAVEAEILAKLRALQGMWTKPEVDKSVAPNALPYQINKCAACIIARIAADSEILRNLRVVLQSRTRTRKYHRAPTLMLFVDECIRQFGSDEAEEICGTASNLAFQMKATRKACIKAWLNDNKNSRRHQKKRRDDRHRDGKPDGLNGSTRPSSHLPSIDLQPEYSRATPVPEAGLEPLRVGRVDSQREEELRMSKVNFQTSNPNGSENDSFLDYSSSDYWTDASWNSEEMEPASILKPQLPPKPQSRAPVRQEQPRVMTTWDMMVDQSNMF
ncbi:uncharacterized protein N7477_002130 [Penicillium maclennaniae]|uniref:uncharacterized protein n=1 Tax=Penicillium maclennaniae TaxID=1343394 RepID=UPI002541D552|nr:uncharacterized protein N7477_002130 [Penicillium maclennaniae]KAJ5676497.1 hypothetical protein N7477_002130 [Penicillium maclennaniae]